MPDAELGIKITGDSKDFEKEAARAERATKRLGREIADSGEKLRNYGVGAVAAGALVAKGLGSTVNAAADLGETVSKANELFGDSVDDVVEYGDAAADALGQSKQEAIDAASSFAIYGRSAGLAGKDLTGFSTELVTLASDMASFNNVGTEETISAIGSALAGEAEPMKRFGVLLNDATLKARAMKMGLIETTTEALSPQNKVLAAHQEILAQTTVQQGDFARTQDGLPNKLKRTKAEFENIQAEIGERLLPVADKLVGVTGDLVGVFDSLPKPLQDVAVYGTAAGSGIAIVGGTALTAFGQVRKWRGEMMASGTTVKGLASSLKSNLNPAVVGGTLAIGAGLAIYGKWRAEQKAIANAAEGMTESLLNGDDAVSTYNATLEQTLDRTDGAEQAFRDSGLSVKRFTDEMDKGGDALDDVRHQFHESNGDLRVFRERLTDSGTSAADLGIELLDLVDAEQITEKQMVALVTAMASLGQEANETSAEIAEQVNQLQQSEQAASFTREEQELLNKALEADTLTEQRDALAEFSSGNLDAAKAAGVNTDAIEANTEATEESTEATQSATDALKEHRDQVLAQFDPVFAYSKSLGDVADAVVEANEAQKEHGEGSRQHREALFDLASANSAADAAVLELRSAFDQGTTSAAGMTSQLDEWVKRGRLSREQADLLGEAIVKTKVKADNFGSPTLRIGTAQAEANLRRTRDYLNNIRGVLNSISNSQGLVIRGGSGLAREMKADGGRVYAGRGYIVGERGPELFDPDVSGTIIPNHKLGHATASNTIVASSAAPVNITVNALDPRGAANAVMEAISQYERTNGTHWRN